MVLFVNIYPNDDLFELLLLRPLCYAEIVGGLIVRNILEQTQSIEKTINYSIYVKCIFKNVLDELTLVYLETSYGFYTRENHQIWKVIEFGLTCYSTFVSDYSLGTKLKEYLCNCMESSFRLLLLHLELTLIDYSLKYVIITTALTIL